MLLVTSTAVACGPDSIPDDFGDDESGMGDADELTPRDLTVQQHCDGSWFGACSGSFTGPSCTLPCVVDPVGGADETGASSGPPPGCGIDYYCHSAGLVYGLATKNAFLYEASPNETDADIEKRFKSWILRHEDDLGLSPGLALSNLGLQRRIDFRNGDGSLTFFRFAQRYRTFPVATPDDIVTLAYTPDGAISVTGAIVDNRVAYANSTYQASSTKARTSIEYYVNGQTQIPVGQIRVHHLRLIAIPQAQAIGWAGWAKHVNGSSIAHVVVDADRFFAGPILPLWSYSDGSHDGLAATQPVTVRSTDPGGDISDPLFSIATTLTTGGQLLGSIDDVSSDIQLATERVVVLDLNGGSEQALGTVASRVLDPAGQFLASSGSDLTLQVSHHLFSSWHALIDGYMTDPFAGAKRWDSANSVYGAQLSAPPGTYVPRVLIFGNGATTDCPVNASSCVQVVGYAPLDPDAIVFPEISHGPEPGWITNFPEATARVAKPSTEVHVMAHEGGHLWDAFVGPGVTMDLSPGCAGNCQLECIEDTTDEGPPLSETIAQMFAQIELLQSFDVVDFGYCDVIGLLSRNNEKSYDPGPCVPPGEDISVLHRPAACAKPAAYCDKPEEPEFNTQCCYDNEDLSDCSGSDTVQCPPGSVNSQGGVATGQVRIKPTGRCAPRHGYNTHSVLQAFWQLLNGYSCSAVAPFDCVTAEYWPNNLTPMDAVVPAFLYSLRLNPLTYQQMFDNMATYVACNYGPGDAYKAFNAVVCGNGLRDCAEPPPATCGECGNGVREGGEECDGQDWLLATCTDFPIYDGGTLQCEPPGSPAECRLDFSMCTMPSADTTVASMSSTSAGQTAAGSSAGSGDDGSGSGASDDGGDGCECRTGDREGVPAFVIAIIGVLLHRPRRRR